MSSVQISNAATKAQQQVKALAASDAKAVQPPPPPPPPPPPAPEPAQSEFVAQPQPRKLTLDPTAGQKSLTELPELAGKLPKSFSASSLQLTGGKGADFTFTKAESAFPTEAVATAASPGASTQAQLDEDAKRIAQEQQKSGPAAGVRTMEALLEQRKNEPDFEEYRKQLLIAAEPTIQALADQVRRPQMDQKKEQELFAALESVAKISTAAGPEATQRTARAFAAGLDDGYLSAQPGTTQARAIEQMAKGEGGVKFATALATELAAVGKTGSADQAGMAAIHEVNNARADFQAKEEEVKKLNAQLQKIIHEAGPALTEADQQKIAETFRKQNSAAYDEWEKAGARLAQHLKSPSVYTQLSEDPRLSRGLRKAAEAGIEGTAGLIDSISNTEAGTQWIAEEMMKEAQGEKTLLAQMGEVAKDKKDVGDKFALALGKGAAWMAMQGAKGGMDVSFASKVLVKYSDVFGLKKEDMTAVVGLFGEFKPGMSTAEVREVSKRINDKLVAAEAGSPFGSEGPRNQALRTVGLAFAASSLTGDWSEFGSANLGEQMKTVGDTIGALGDAGVLFMDVFTKAQRFGALHNIAKVAGPVGGAIAAIGEGVVAIDAFMRGDKGQALESGLLSAGGLFLAAASLQGFPVAGQVLGAGLLVAGLGVKIYNEGEEKKQFEEQKRKLFADVYPDNPGLQQAMCNADKDQLNKLLGLGFSQSQLQKLGSTYPSLFLDAPHVSLQGLKRMQQSFNMSMGELEAFLHAAGGGSDQELMNFLGLTETSADFATPLTREQWIKTFDEYARTGPTKTREAYRRAAEALRTRSGATD